MNKKQLRTGFRYVFIWKGENMNHLIEVEVKNEGKENARLKAYFEAVKETARKNKKEEK